MISPYQACYALVTLLAFGYFAHVAGLFAAHKNVLPRVVDALLASFSLGLSLMLIGWLDSKAYPLYDGKLLSSGVAFFNSARPPSPKAFVVCTASAFLVGTLLHQLNATPGLNTQAIALSMILFVWKLSGSNFSATVGLAIFLAESGWKDSWERPLFYLCCPWLSGHGLLYALALVLAVPRAHVRVYLSQREWRRSLSGAALSEGGTAVERPSAAAVRARMREAFTRLDTSGDGRLDATEFKVALRSLMQLDLPIEDCASIIHGIDQNGDGTLDFDEFCQAVDMKLEQQAGALEFTKLSVLFYAKLKHHTASHHEQISGHKATMATKKSD